MNRDDALKKIKKCLALGQAADAHEAAAAMRQAQKLMAEHQVTERDLSLVDVREIEARASTLALSQWEANLAHMVAESFGCEMFTRARAGFNDSGNYGRQRFMVYVGLDAAPEVAAYAFEVLSRQCARARRAHMRKQPRNCKPATRAARGDEFARGWVAGASHLVERFAQREKDEVLLLTYMEQKYPNMFTTTARDAAKRRRQDAGHQMAGFRAGRDAELHRGVGGVEPRGLLT